MKFNINEIVECVLTDLGEAILEDENTIAYKHSFNQVTHTLRVPLWEIMNIFGKKPYNGSQLIFIKNEIML